MKRCYFILLLFAFVTAHGATVASPRAALQRAYDHVLPPIDNPQARAAWAPLTEQELSAIVKTRLPVNKFAFYAGFKLKSGHDILLLRFIKPALMKDQGFCRSDIALYQIHNYKPGLQLATQNITTAGHYGELVSFQKDDILSGCQARALIKLNDYIFVNSFLSDQTIAELHNAYIRMRHIKAVTSNCTIRADAQLVGISLGVYGSINSPHYYYFFIKNGENSTSITFTLKDGHAKVEECALNVIS